MFDDNAIVNPVPYRAQHGHVDHYLNVPGIPGPIESGWESAPNGETVGFSRTSVLPSGTCHKAIDYTFFQTFGDIPSSTVFGTFTIEFSGMDDGSRITIFNSVNPGGVVVPGSYVFLNQSSTIDLSSVVVAGETNRVVITQIDDCPVGNNLITANINLNGSVLSLNEDPSLGASDVSVNEGSTADNGGSITDSDGDSVALSALPGSVVNNNDETWSWTGAGNELDNGTYDVTITGDDGNGGTNEVTFTVTVNNVAPMVVSGIADVTIGSGETVVLNAGFTDAGVDDTHAAIVDWGGATGSPSVSDTSGSAAGTVSDSHQFFGLGENLVTVTVSDLDGGTSEDETFTVTVVRAPIDIDVKPGSDVNPLNLNGNGVVPIAVLGRAGFDVSDLIPSTVLAGVDGDNASPVNGGHIEDVNGDGIDDYVFHFREYQLGVAVGTPALSEVEIILTAEGLSGVFFAGSDWVRINPNNSKSKGKCGKGPK